MRLHEQRTSTGSLKPNIYFLLQVAITILIVYIILQFNLSTGAIYIVTITFIISIAYFLIKRKKVLDRQNHPTKN